MSARPLLAAVALLLAMPAAAQDRPTPLPTRDVDVTYRIAAGAQSIEQRSRFTTARQRMRVDRPTPGVYSIMDYRSHMMNFVVDGDRASLDTAVPVPPVQSYARLGIDQVAGLGCTEWQARDTQNQPVVTCFTDDGVMLRVRRGTQPMAVATRVVFAPQDPALFAVPPGYQHVTRQTR